MTLPWNFLNNGVGTSYYPAAMSYDMCSGGLMNSFNLQWNQGIDDCIARMGLYQVPQFNFTNFTTYANPFMMNNSYLLDPLYTMGQMDWQNRVRFGVGLFNADGQIQMPGMYSPFGWTPSGIVQPGSNNNTETEEDAKYQTKLNKLRNFLSELKTNNVLDDEDKDIINNAITKGVNDKKGSKAKYEYLLEKFKEVTKDNDRFIKNIGKINVNGEPINNLMNEMGAEETDREAGDLEQKIRNFHKTINELDKNPVDSSTKCDLISQIEIKNDSIPILAVISEWNSTFKGQNDRNIIKFITDEINKDKDNDKEEYLNGKVIWPLVDALISEADKVVEEKIDNTLVLSNDYINTINEIKGVLNTNYTNREYTKLAENFDELYRELRKATAIIAREKAQTHFEFLGDANFINEETFVKEAKADLEEEFAGENVDIDALFNTDSTVRDNDKPKTAEEKVTDLVKKEHLAELTTTQKAQLKTLGVEIKNAYVERYVKNGENASVYVIKDGEIVKVENVTVEDGNVVKIDTNSDASTDGDEVKADDIEERSKKIIKEKEEEKNAEEKAIDFNTTGRQFMKQTDGLSEWSWNTDDTFSNTLNTELGKINDKNVISFLDGAYGYNYNPTEGIMERLDDDTNSTATMVNKKNLVNSLLTRAESCNLQNSENYKELTRIMKLYETTAYKGREDFNEIHDARQAQTSADTRGKTVAITVAGGIAGYFGATKIGAAIGTAITPGLGTMIGAAVGFVIGCGALIYNSIDKHTDNEVIDDCMQALYKEIKEAEAKKTK